MVEGTKKQTLVLMSLATSVLAGDIILQVPSKAIGTPTFGEQVLSARYHTWKTLCLLCLAEEQEDGTKDQHILHQE